MLKSEPVTPSVDPTPDGHYELSPLLDKMVEAELQAVMAKIWDLTPINPQDVAEKIALDRLRQAGESMKNVLGLNVTKRLLNLHNPLYVKMVFSGKPPRAQLVSFLRQHSVTAFKRVGEKGGTFAAKMRSFQDLDQLCTGDGLKCGNVSVKVTPCYQFKTCPPNLRTRYDGKTPNTGVASNDTSQLTVSQEFKKPEQIKTVIPQNSTPKVTPKPPPKIEVKQTLAQASPIKTQEKASPITQTKASPITQAKASPITQAKASPITQAKASPITQAKASPITQAKVSQITQAKASPITQAKASPITPAKTSPITPANTSPATTSLKVENKPVSTTTESKPQNAVAKVTPAKTVVPQNPTKQNPIPIKPNQSPKIANTNQNAPKPTVAAQQTVKPTTVQNTAVRVPVKATQNNQNAPKVVPKQPQQKIATPKAKVATAKPSANLAGTNSKLGTKPKVSPKKKPSDFDELSDHDILALISEGIVLDECSGSEVE